MEKSGQLSTPYFVINTDKVDLLVDEIQRAVHKYWPQGITGYSFKTNNLPWIISHMKQKGLWAEVVSSDEFRLAEELGYDPKHIIFNGPVKEKEDFIKAVEGGSVVNIDSQRELKWLLECNKMKLNKSNLGLRVNFCLEEYCQGESQCSSEDGRFGFSYESGELKKAILFLNNNNIPLSGLHLHCSSKTRSLNIYKAIAEVSVKIVREYNINLKYLDIGGGYFGGVSGKPKFDDYFNNVYEIINSEKLFRNINIIIEPGMSVIGAGVDYVTSVIDIKSTKNNKFAILDGSRIHIDPLMRKISYVYHLERKLFVEDSVKESDQILCGFTCMEEDRFFKLKNAVLAVGDHVVFEKVGAYTVGLSPQFIEFYPDVYALRNNEMMLVRPKWTARNFINNRR